MLPARFAQCSRAVASSSSVPTSAACLHTSAILQASAFRKRKSRVAEKANIEKRAERYRLAALNRPHVILGNRPGDDAKWLNCDLAKVVITEEQILAAPILKPSSQAPQGQPDLPKFMNYGVGEKEKQMLFETLPALTVEALHLRVAEISGNILPSYMQEQGAIAEAKELKKTSQLAALVDLRNANAGGIAYENRKRIVDAFSDPGKPGDTGRPEVQAAIMTYQIRNLWDHLSKFKKDIANRRSLRRLVHQRAKILKYLKRVDRDRYDVVLERLGLEPASVEGELVV